MSQDYRQENLAKLKEIMEKQPSAVDVYFRIPTADGGYRTVGVPIQNHAERDIMNHPDWKLESSNVQMDDTVAKLFADKNDLPEEVDMSTATKRPAQGHYQLPVSEDVQ